MPNVDIAVEHQYYEAHPEVDRYQVYLWTHFADQTDHAYWIGFAFRDWLKSDRHDAPPDLVEYIATYGYVRLRLQTWELPLKLTPEEMKQWREAGYYVSKEDFYEPIARVAGGFLKLAGTESALTAEIIQGQLDEKLAELERLAAIPLEDYYTPRMLEWQLREEAAGFEDSTEEEKEYYVLDTLVEDTNHFGEVEVFERLFGLRQQLESFEWGMEKLRLIALSEQAPDLGLPNSALFKALMRIDLNALLARLSKVDKDLRKIWQHLATYNCFCLNKSYEPERFWWRHQPEKLNPKHPRHNINGETL